MRFTQGFHTEESLKIDGEKIGGYMSAMVSPNTQDVMKVKGMETRGERLELREKLNNLEAQE